MTKLSDIEAVRAVATRVGCVLSGSSLDGEGSIRQMLEQLETEACLFCLTLTSCTVEAGRSCSDAKRLQKIADAIKYQEFETI